MEIGAGVQWYRKTFSLAVGLALIACLVLGLSKLDPFGFASATDRLSRHFSQMFFVAPFYRAAVNERNYPAVVVFLFDQKYVETLPSKQNRHWPLTYTQQYEVFEKILNFGPKGLFVDLLYYSEHGEQDSPEVLTQLIADKSAATPIVLPAVLSSPYDCDGQMEAEKDRSFKDSAVLMQFRGAASDTGYLGSKNCDNSYPLVINEGRRWLSPAMALYQAHRASKAQTAQPETSQLNGTKLPAANESRHFSLKNFNAPLVIQWGSDIDPHSRALLESQGGKCQAVGTGFWGRATYPLTKLYKMMVSDSEGDSRLYESCPAITTFHASLLNYEHIGSEALLGNLVKDAYVFIGTQVGLHPDISRVPVFGTVPGVYTHAMAFDNLLQYGEGYKRQPRWKFFEFFFEGLILFAALAVRESLRRWRPFPELHEPLDARALWWVVVSIISPLLISALVIVPVLTLTTFQMNWFGMLLLGFVVAPPRIFAVWERYETKFLNWLEGKHEQKGKIRKVVFFCVQYVGGVRRVVFGHGGGGRNQKVSR